jgi:hypothetical protein
VRVFVCATNSVPEAKVLAIIINEITMVNVVMIRAGERYEVIKNRKAKELHLFKKELARTGAWEENLS